MLGGALLAVVPATSAAANDDLPAPAPPNLVSAVASGTGQPGQSTVTVTIVTTPNDYQREFFDLYANGYNMALGGAIDGFPASTQAGQPLTATYPICASVTLAPAWNCVSQQAVDAMQVGSTIKVTATGQNTGPDGGNPIEYSVESAPNNAVNVTVG